MEKIVIDFISLDNAIILACISVYVYVGIKLIQIVVNAIHEIIMGIIEMIEKKRRIKKNG